MSHNTSQRAQDLAVTITLDEHERRSRAVARLRWRDRTLIGSGPSRIGANGSPSVAFTRGHTPQERVALRGRFCRSQIFGRPHSVNACRDVEYLVSWST